MELSFVKNGYWTIIKQKKTWDSWEVWVKFKSKIAREKFDEKINKMIDKWWFIEEVLVDTGLNLFFRMKKWEKGLF
jgi:hypothetical protein